MESDFVFHALLGVSLKKTIYMYFIFSDINLEEFGYLGKCHMRWCWFR